MKVFWADHALEELEETFKYLEQNFSEREIRRLAAKIEVILKLISNNPKIYPQTNCRESVRKALVTRHNTLYYRAKKDGLEILSFFANRKDPESLSFD